MKKRILMGLAAFALLFSSCQKDYLLTIPTDSTTGEVVFSNMKGLNFAAKGMYSTMSAYGGHEGIQGLNGEPNYHVADDFMGGLIARTIAGSGWFGGYYNYANPTSYTNQYVWAPWRMIYRYAKNANQILAKVDDIPTTSAEEVALKAYIKAEALAFRAYGHYRGGVWFADRYRPGQVNSQLSVPFKDNLDQLAIPRETLENLYKRCMDDYDLALGIMLGEGKTVVRPDKWYIRPEVIYALKARIYMIKGEWSLALAEAEKIILPGNYTIMGPDQMIGTWMGTAARDKNKEVIWGLDIEPIDGVSWSSLYMHLGNSGSPFVASGPFSMDRRLFESIPATDHRKNFYLNDTPEQIKANLASNPQYYYDGGAGSAVYGPYAPQATGTQIVPLQNRKFQSTDRTRTGGGDFVMIRLAEVLYVAAEAAYMSGDMTKAAKYLTDATLPYDATFTAKSGPALLQQIIDYKHFDLWGEGRSYEDIKRRNGAVIRDYPGTNANFTLGIYKNISVQDNSLLFKFQVPKAEIDSGKGVIVPDPS